MFNIYSVDNGVCSPKGFFADGISCGLRSKGIADLAFIYSDLLCDMSYLLSSNKFKAAPLVHMQGKTQTNFILINSKNANSLTGDLGLKDIDEIFKEMKFEGIQNPIMSSTGIIGIRLNKDLIIKGLNTFDLKNKNSSNAAKAIMTTDSYPKEIALKVELDDGTSFSIGAIAKGAGMINPCLATMLCFISTDADISKEDMDELLKESVDRTFNAISVDGDTSTNDTVILLSNKKSKAYNKEAFREALNIITKDLALSMVRDGEGAKKLVAFRVSGAYNNEEAKKLAKALSNSLLVKTALFGEDPNWGRIASTIGASGVSCDEKTLKISFEDVLVYDKGEIYFTQEIQDKASLVLKKSEFSIYCDLAKGEGEFTAYGCDLGHNYIDINSNYRT